MQAQTDVGSEDFLQATTAHDEAPTYHKVGYARVSTGDQDLRLQLDALIRDGVREEDIYRETLCARSKRRPEFERMMRELRPHDMVVAWKPDRLFRSIRHGVAFIDELEKKGVKLRILTQIHLDTSTPTGKLILHMLLAVAEFEADLTRERTMAGLRSAKARGRVGGARPIYSDEQIRDAVRMFDSGATWAEAAATVIAERGKRKGQAITVTRLRTRAGELKGVQHG